MYTLPAFNRRARKAVHVLTPALVLCLLPPASAQPNIPYGEDVLLLTVSRVMELPAGERPAAMREMVRRVRQRGVAFKLSAAVASKFRALGATPALVAVIRENYRRGAETPVSGGVMDARALNLPRPVYPPIAKAGRISGAVTVEVLVNERGEVIWAEAVGGHPLLTKAAVDAARAARFTPAKLSGRAVKMTGLITYNFRFQ